MNRTLQCLALALAGAGAGCVTVDVEPDGPGSVSSHSVVIPLHGGALGGAVERDPLAEYYESALMLMHDAVLERNPARLRELCDLHDREVAPDWARTQIARFRETAAVLELEHWIADEARVVIRGERAPPLGAAIPLRIDVPAFVGSPVTVGGRRSSAGFQVRVVIEDRDCFGGSIRRAFTQLLELPDAIAIGEAGLAVSFDVDALVPEGVLRIVRVRAEWLPGNVAVGHERVPSRRVRCEDARFELFPVGVDAIHAAPLKTLRIALERGEAKHMEHVFLAARAMPPAEREAASELLIRHLRVGDRVRGRACMAALREITGEAISLDDRRGWLRWWAERRSD